MSQLEQDLAELQGQQAAAKEASHNSHADADRSVADALLQLDAADSGRDAAQQACSVAQEQVLPLMKAALSDDIHGDLSLGIAALHGT